MMLIRDGDSISGVIVSSGTNQDGKTNGITAPSMQSQLELITEVYRRGEIDPGTIQFVEAHGTGTRLGDPIEMESLARVFQNSGRPGQFCRLGSLKANLGHTTAAAGVAGLIKVLLSIKHRAIPPQIHFDTPNRQTAYFNGLAPCKHRAGILGTGSREAKTSRRKCLRLQRHELSPCGRRGAGTSRSVTPPRPGKEFWIVLSAKTRRALEEKAAELSGWLESKEGLVSLTDLSFTLTTGRSAFEERLAFVARDLAEVRAGLEKFLVSSRAGVKISGSAEPGAAWVSGANVDWVTLYQGLAPRRIPLPHLPVWPRTLLV